MKNPVTTAIAIIAAIMIVGLVLYNVLPLPVYSNPAPTPVDTGTTGYGQKLAAAREKIVGVYMDQQAREITLALDEIEINEAAANFIGQISTEVPTQIKNVSVDLQTGNLMQIKLAAISLGITYDIVIMSRLGITDGMPEVEVVSVNVPFLLSQFRGSIAGTARDKSNQMLKQMISGISSGYEGTLEVRCTAIDTTEDSIKFTLWAQPLAG